MPTDRSITGVILAGGQASRMDGRDKGLIRLNDRPLIEHVIAAIRPQVDAILINANRNIEHYRSYGYPVISDRIPDYAGPLAGMLAALQQTDSELLLCVPCDGPWLPADLLSRLQSAMQESAAEISCAHDGERLHPVFALLKQSVRQPLADYIDTGGRAVHRWFKSRKLAQVDFSDCPELFININTAEELQRATAKLSGEVAE
ncbi:MAG: molybdenum cofactor guanylyltransferase MobA [Pseudomonadota bacterium]